MIKGLLTLFSSTKMQAGSALPVVPAPRVKPGSQSLPSYLKTANPSKTTPIAQTDRRLINVDITTYRNGANTQQVIRDFAAASPDLSAAIFAYLRTAITKEYTAVAKNVADGTFNPEATALVQHLLARFDLLPDYSDGFSGTNSIRSTSESLGKEIMLTGAMAAELVLGKDRLPRRIQPIAVSQLKFIPDNGILKPVQVVGGQQIDLDVPTFFYVALDQSLLDAYPSSPLEAALQPILFSQEFLNDVRRVVKRAIHPRVKVVIDEEKFRKSMPQEIQHDESKFLEYQASVIASIKATMDNLAPEDALIYFDTIGITLENNGNTSLSKEYEILSKMADAKMATGAKTLPAILGHGSGSSNIASTETMLQMLSAYGAVQSKLNEMYSRILTLGVRLFGFDVTVEFAYAPVDLRPESELEAFKAQKQSRVLELLSLGLVTDEEASLSLTGRLPPTGFKSLSGTMFKSNQSAANPNPNGDTNGGSTLNQNLNSDAPKGVRGGNNKANPQKG